MNLKQLLSAQALLALATLGGVYVFVDGKYEPVTVVSESGTWTEDTEASDKTKTDLAIKLESAGVAEVTCSAKVDEKRGPGTYCTKGSGGFWLDEAIKEDLGAEAESFDLLIEDGKLYRKDAAQ